MKKRTRSSKSILVEFQPKIEVVIDGYDVEDTYDIQNVAQIIDDLNSKTIVSASSIDKDILKEIQNAKSKLDKGIIVRKKIGTLESGW